MLVLLPPSEGKSVPRRGRPLDLDALSFPELAQPRADVLAALTALCTADADKAAHVLGLGPTQAAEIERNAELLDAPTVRADALYTGVLYDHLDLATLSPAARRRATRRLAITSSVFGLLRPGDRVPAYRLSGDVTLPGLGGVAAHWRRVLDPVARAAAGQGLVVDLRSSTYAAFWRPAPDVRLATVRVLQERDGRRSVVSHFNKATKGRLVRALLESGADPRTPAALADAVRDLGWHVEQEAERLDVVVTDL